MPHNDYLMLDDGYVISKPDYEFCKQTIKHSALFKMFVGSVLNADESFNVWRKSVKNKAKNVDDCRAAYFFYNGRYLGLRDACKQVYGDERFTDLLRVYEEIKGSRICH